MTAVLDHNSAAPARRPGTIVPQRGVPGQTRMRPVPTPGSPAAEQDRGTALVALAHGALRRTAVRVLRGLGAREVLAAPDVAVARAAASRRAGAVCVVEPAFGGGSGLSLVRDAALGGWGTVVVVDGRREAGDPGAGARSAFAAGARCYLLVDPADETPADGGDADGPGSRRATPAAEPVAPSTGCDELSEREVQVVSLVADGRSNREVGEILGLSALTVKSHLARIARKLGTGDRAEMVAITLRAGLLR